MSLRQRTVRAGAWSAVSTGAVACLQVFQLLALAAALTKQEFGLFAVSAIAVHIATQLSDLGIGPAIIHHRDCSPGELSTLFWLNVGVGAALFSATAATGPFLCYFFNEPLFTPLMTLAALPLLIGSAGRQFQYLLQKSLSFRTLAIADVAGAAAGVSASILVAYNGGGVFAFPIGACVNCVLSTAILVGGGIAHHCPAFHFAWSDTHRYMRFGAFLTGDRVLNILSARVDSAVIGSVLGIDALGLYHFAQQLTSRVMIKANAVFSRLSFPVLAEIQDNPARMHRTYCRMLKVLCYLVFPVLAGLAMTSRDLLAIFYEDRWPGAGILVTLLSILVLLKTVISPIGSLLMASGRTDIGFCMNLYILIQHTIAIAVGCLVSVELVACMLIASTCVSSVIWVVVLNKCLLLNPWHFIASVANPAIGAAVMASVIWLYRECHSLGHMDLSSVLLALSAGAASYGVYVALTQRHLFRGRLLMFQRVAS